MHEFIEKKVQFYFCPIETIAKKKNVYCSRSNFVIPSSCAPLRILRCMMQSVRLSLFIIHSRSTHGHTQSRLPCNYVYMWLHDIFPIFIFFHNLFSTTIHACMHTVWVLSDVHRWRFIVHTQNRYIIEISSSHNCVKWWCQAVHT